jgi:D-glycerate 3-kinase
MKGKSKPAAHASWQQGFLHAHQLDERYLSIAQRWFNPLATNLANFHATASRPILLAVNGCQGSGKSTLAAYLVAALEHQHQRVAVSLSLDDFYCTQARRRELAQTIHPLFATRGVPGTHDMALLNKTLDALLSAGTGTDPGSVINIPEFNKAIDDRLPESSWALKKGEVDIVILEGWCLGVCPESEQQLASPVNALEEQEDPDGIWRCYVNHVIKEQFLPLYQRVDQWLMLQASSFECVYRWRLEQEQKLANSLSRRERSKVMSEKEIARFIRYYQRLTQRCLGDLPRRVHYLYQLGADRNIMNYEWRERIPD